jgi:methionyl aminopeptidase
MKFEMISLKSESEIELIRISSLLVGKTLGEVARNIRPGITTAELDRIAEEFIRDHGGQPAFKGYNGFPATLCISVNEGDLVSVDCGVLKDGYYGDSAYTFAVGDVAREILLLMQRTKEALYLGIEAAVAGKRVGDIGHAVQHHVEMFGYAVVRDLVGHGVGKQLHEKPEIPNYGKRGEGIQLREGMTICIEPMINMGTRMVIQEKDGWTIRTADHKPSAHYEHTVSIRKDKSEILSTFSYVEEVINHS